MASRTNAAQELSRRGQHYKQHNNFSSEIISSMNKLLEFSATEFSVISPVRQIQAYQKTGFSFEWVHFTESLSNYFSLLKIEHSPF